ncbi:DUF4340 domain-containing protein [Thermostichus vulcanus]|uniref:DUF4340 domain-containing protein n=1 Tax=Thermostichus vulcanus str. 'Rupite' TaxID=2813851 RepID=A0ABT0C8P4_THEVL|nr:DUF4340 domain-containing protein [Thermostichus vulcanus]MCJ2542162.1 DUF4340 domain-containing protein [Thermostichus vulcanus str. 'Rupite']
MFKRTTLILLGLAVACILGYFLFDNAQQLRQQAEAERAKLFHVQTDTIARIEIQQQSSDEPELIVLERVPDSDPTQWRILSPIQSAALDFPISSLLNTFSRLTPEITLEGSLDNPEDLAAFGLDNPKQQITLMPQAGDPYRLSIGNDNFDRSGFYARANDGEVVLIASAQKGSLLPSLLALRDKTLLSFDSADVESFQVRLAEADPEQFQIERQGNGWQITDPKRLPADDTNVNRLLNTLARLQAVEFPAETQADLAPYGLDNPSAQLTIKLAASAENSDPAPLTVALGSETNGQVHVITSQHPAVATLLTSTADILRSDLEDLRDHRIARLNANQIEAITLASEGEEITLQPLPSESGSPGIRWENPDQPGQAQELTSIFSTLNSARASEFLQDDPEAQKSLQDPTLRLTFRPKPDSGQDPLTLSLAPSGLRAYVQSSYQPDIAVIDLSTFHTLETEVNRLLEQEEAS